MLISLLYILAVSNNRVGSCCVNLRETAKKMVDMGPRPTGDGSWGHLADSEHVGRQQFDYITLSAEDLKGSVYSQCQQAAHCMIYSRHEKKVFEIYSPRAAVLMQMRFDGYLGFPGGLVDEGESNIVGLNRELVEEMGVDLNRVSVKEEDHVVSHYSPSKKLCLHFYATEAPLGEIQHIEHNSTNAYDYGTEALGTIRVPLYTMGDGYRGFPNFLTNSFAGNARQQLLDSLVHLKIMTEDEIALALNAKPLPPTAVN